MVPPAPRRPAPTQRRKSLRFPRAEGRPRDACATHRPTTVPSGLGRSIVACARPVLLGRLATVTRMCGGARAPTRRSARIRAAAASGRAIAGDASTTTASSSRPLREPPRALRRSREGPSRCRIAVLVVFAEDVIARGRATRARASATCPGRREGAGARSAPAMRAECAVPCAHARFTPSVGGARCNTTRRPCDIGVRRAIPRVAWRIPHCSRTSDRCSVRMDEAPDDHALDPLDARIDLSATDARAAATWSG